MTASNNLPLTLAKLPEKLREQLKICPAEGNGIHSWLFRTALRLHERFAENEIVEILKTHLTCRRPKREIIDTVENSAKGGFRIPLATKTSDPPNYPPRPRGAEENDDLTA